MTDLAMTRRSARVARLRRRAVRLLSAAVLLEAGGLVFVYGLACSLGSFQ